MILYRKDFTGHHVPQVLAHLHHFLHLGGGKGEALDEGRQVQAGEIDEIADPVHRYQHFLLLLLFMGKLAQGL